ncbi:MAG: plasmid pRiA4b family protein, partial [Pseudonocardiales bacterium]|nr:plasmid pRiA4b family protein [Pseudonocardiales bacterium]
MQGRRGESMTAMARARRITAKTRIFQLKIQIATIRPPVWRRVLVPGEIDLGELHAVIQTAFGWTNSHLHQFEIGE